MQVVAREPRPSQVRMLPRPGGEGSVSHPVFAPPTHRFNAGPGPLVIRRGEERIDGLVNADLDSSSLAFTMLACSYAEGHVARSWIPHPRGKTVKLTNATRLYLFGEPSSQLGLHRSDDRPFHVTVIGQDGGSGRALVARVVWFERATAHERTYARRHTSAAPTTASRVPPLIGVIKTVIQTDGHAYPVTLIRAKLSTVRVRVGLAHNKIGATESLAGIAKDYGAIAAINGSFFDCYDPGLKKPDMEVISNGVPRFKGDIGTLIGFTPDGRCAMARSPHADALHDLDPAYPDEWEGAPHEATLLWQQVTEALGAGPRLVNNGAICLAGRSEGFKSAEVLDSIAVRSAVGYTSRGTLLLITTKCSLPALARIMRASGCAHAMNLDGGTSTGLWYRGKYLIQPGRQISNALLILPK